MGCLWLIIGIFWNSCTGDTSLYSYNAGGNSFLEGQPVLFPSNSFPKTPAAQLASLTKEYASIERNPRRSKSSILSQADLQNIKSGNYDPAAYQRIYRPPVRQPNPTSKTPATTIPQMPQVPATTIRAEIKKSEDSKITRRSAKATCRVEIPGGNTCPSAAITLENFVNKLMVSQNRDRNPKLNDLESQLPLLPCDVMDKSAGSSCSLSGVDCS